VGAGGVESRGGDRRLPAQAPAPAATVRAGGCFCGWSCRRLSCIAEAAKPRCLESVLPRLYSTGVGVHHVPELVLQYMEILAKSGTHPEVRTYATQALQNSCLSLTMSRPTLANTKTYQRCTKVTKLVTHMLWFL
jgi:predicted dinucleotide-utilizing enzyme